MASAVFSFAFDPGMETGMNILIDGAIFQLQSQGGISRLWRSLLPALRDAMPEAINDLAVPPDWFISTYYKPAPLGVRSLVVVMDWIAERYPLIGQYHPDAVDKRRAVANATAVVAISQMVADDTRRYAGKVATVAYPGLDAEFGRVLPSDVTRFRAYIGKPYILCVGKRGLYKNVQALYQAWALWGAHAGYKLVCVGGEDNLPQDTAFAGRYPDTWQRVVLDDYDLQLAYAGAAALCYPSLMEGFGLPLIEAQACACPVICDPSVHEVAGDAAYYVDTTRPRQIADALDVVTTQPDATRLAAGAAWVKQFTWTGMAQTIAGVLRNMT